MAVEAWKKYKKRLDPWTRCVATVLPTPCVSPHVHSTVAERELIFHMVIRAVDVRTASHTPGANQSKGEILFSLSLLA